MNIKKKKIALINSIKIIDIEKRFNILIEDNIFNYINKIFSFKLLKLLYFINHILSIFILFLHILLVQDKIICNIIINLFLSLFVSYYTYLYFPVIPYRLFSKNKLNQMIIFNINIDNYIIKYHSIPSIHLIISLIFTKFIYLYYKSIFIFIHPIITILCILGTKNHYIIDLIVSIILEIIVNLII